MAQGQTPALVVFLYINARSNLPSWRHWAVRRASRLRQASIHCRYGAKPQEESFTGGVLTS
ncbi:hypothetical protein JAAARDRAFT_42895 [Jaapia argillacea MUCL 33604]|uniref:Uncharacterized protein n=1 Tax=Jaapia argillacea MUCL 33604 TaxID=933084 RepID=A0A067P6P9_9AGAM|nr:hypothetical protein JAAARDRAFT_42895 [Jaapia argillacea MUCL 33604]